MTPRLNNHLRLAPEGIKALMALEASFKTSGIEEGLQYETAQFGLMFSTDDMREGTRAFTERRKPTFTGH